MFWSCIICVVEMVVNVKNNQPFHLDNTCARVDQLEVSWKSFYEGTDKAWNKFLEPAINITSPYNGMAVGAKTKNPEIGRAPGSILKSNSGVKILSLIDMYGNGVRLKLM